MTQPPLRHQALRAILGGTCLSLLATACGDDIIYQPLPPEPGEMTSSSAGTTTTRPSGSSSMSTTEVRPNQPAAPAGETTTPAAEAEEVEVSGEISADTTWTTGKTYHLTGNAPVFVTEDATLTIEPGVTILGGSRTALVVTRGSQLKAEGTAAQPIVFTSDLAEGRRRPGNWGGVVLLGSAPVNVASASVEGISPESGLGDYGGTAAEHNCGSLKYVRIEFAGFLFGQDNELNGLTVAGCGSATSIDYVQVHRGLDDGIEMFGGSADLKHVVVTNVADDGLDWDFGWTGRAQFVVVRTDSTAADTAIEADNNADDNDASPRSYPALRNLTLVGGAGSTNPGIILRRGTWAEISAAIVTGFADGAIDVRDAATVAATSATPPGVAVYDSIFFQNGDGGTGHGELDDDGTGVVDALDENAWLATATLNNFISVDPELGDVQSATAPNFVPAAQGGAQQEVAPPPANDPFFVDAPYVGAVPPGGPDWTQGWTAYPEQ